MILVTLTRLALLALLHYWGTVILLWGHCPFCSWLPFSLRAACSCWTWITLKAQRWPYDKRLTNTLNVCGQNKAYLVISFQGTGHCTVALQPHGPAAPQQGFGPADTALSLLLKNSELLICLVHAYIHLIVTYGHRSLMHNLITQLLPFANDLQDQAQLDRCRSTSHSDERALGPGNLSVEEKERILHHFF